MVRKVLFWLHLTAGCIAGLVILTMSLTGVLLAYERQINGWADPHAGPLSSNASSTRASLDALLQTLRAGGQGGPSELVLHNDAKAPVEARYGRVKTVYVDPWSGNVIGQPAVGTRAFFSTVELIHRSLGLGMRSAFGRGLTGAANLAFLFMLVSGLYLWLPRRFSPRSLKSRLLFRGGLQGRAREWNWHNVIGMWASIPLLFIVASGVVMSYPWASNLLYTMTGNPPPVNNGRGDRPRPSDDRASAAREDQDGAFAGFQSIESLAAIVKQQLPDWKSMTIEIPTGNDPTLSVSVDASIGGQPEKVTQVLFNRSNGGVVKIRRFSDNNAGRKLRAWARFTHTGEEFGVIGETIAALASIGAILLVWTGLSMALRRLSGRKRARITPVFADDSEVEAELREAMEV